MQTPGSSNFRSMMRRSSLFSSWAEDASRRRSKLINSISFRDESPVDSPKSTTKSFDGDRSHRQSSMSSSSLTAPSTIVFVDLEGYSKSSDVHQQCITRDFMTNLRDLLTFTYGSPPARNEVDNYVILPTGDGAAVCVMRPPNAFCHGCDSPSLQGTEETALWIGASLLFWASKRKVGLRVGLNSGDLVIVEDPYGDANVCGDAINLAARIMDTATPGQILASSDSVVPKLKESLEAPKCECDHCPHMEYDISPEPSEVVVKHGVTTHVQSIVCTLFAFPVQEDIDDGRRRSTDLLDYRSSLKDSIGSCHDEEFPHRDEPVPNWRKLSFASLSSLYRRQSTDRPIEKNEKISDQTLSSSVSSSKQSTHVPQFVGSHALPKTKWYMKIKPTEMHSDDNSIRPKVLPQELVRRHNHIAFIGITHDNLHRVFEKALEADPTHTWQQVYIFFPSDECLHALAKNLSPQTGDDLINLKNTSKQDLLARLSPVVKDLRLLELQQLMHCGSYWDWKDQGGYIHISPLTWGANPKTCPAMNYYWNSTNPSPEYRVYRDGLEYLLNIATPI